MRFRSEVWVKLARRGRFQMEAKVRIGTKEYTAISAPRIDRSLMGAPLSVGNCTSATLNLSILTEDIIPTSAPVLVLGRITDGEIYSEWLEFGTFFINQRDTSYEGLVTLSCYDAMLKANQSYIDASDTALSWPKSMKSVVEEIAYRIGVSIDPRTRINVGSDYYVPCPTDLTMIQVLGYIGACHGGNWIITEDNALRLVPLVTSPDITYHVISHDYETVKTGDGNVLVYKQQTVFNKNIPMPTGQIPDSIIPATYYITDEFDQPIITPEGHFLVWAADGSADAVDGLINVPAVLGQITNGTTVTVTGVTMSGSDDKVYTSGNKSGSVISVEGNPYATQGICDALYNAFNGLVYAPYTATKAIYDPATELGDQVKIGDKVHSVIYGANMTLDLGFRSDINAPNSEELSEEYPYLSEIKKLKQTTAELNHAITETAKELTEKINTADTDTTRLAEALTDEVNRASSVERELGGRIEDEERRARSAEEGLGDRINSLESGNRSLIQSLADMQTSNDKQSTDIADLKARLLSYEDSLSDMNSSIDAILARLSAIEAQLSGN